MSRPQAARQRESDWPSAEDLRTFVRVGKARGDPRFSDLPDPDGDFVDRARRRMREQQRGTFPPLEDWVIDDVLAIIEGTAPPSRFVDEA